MLTQDPSLSDPRIGACVYLLHGLLQRLENRQPGLLHEMIEGASHDRDAMDAAAGSAEVVHGRQIAEEALRMLYLMRAQLQMRAGADPAV